MKKLFLITACLMAAVLINAQSLNEIVSKYTVANKLDKISAFKTLKITAKMSMMGQDMPMEMWMKNPNKIKTVTNFGGQEMISVFDGEKGYSVNPMAGSTEPTEMTPAQIKNLLKTNVFQNYMENYLKDGLLTLEGEDTVKGNKAFKIKAALEGGATAHLYIDKSSYLMVKTVADVDQGGQTMTIEQYPGDYTLTNGILLPMKTTMSMMGMEVVETLTKVEVDVPINDTIFKVK